MVVNDNQTDSFEFDDPQDFMSLEDVNKLGTIDEGNQDLIVDNQPLNQDPDPQNEEMMDASQIEMLANQLGFDQEFLSDVESVEEFYQKAAFYIQEKTLESLPDEEREYLELRRQGKVSNLKDFVKYVNQDDSDTSVNFDEDSAKSYMASKLKSQGVPEMAIDAVISKLELEDKLIEQATSYKTKEIESRDELKKQREAEFLRQEEVKREKLKQENQEVFQAIYKNVGLKEWDAPVKQYVIDEIEKGLPQTTNKIKAVMSNVELVPEAVNLINRIFKDDGKGNYSIDYSVFTQAEKTKAAQQVTKDWKSAMQSKGIKPLGSDVTKQKENQIEYLV